MYLISLRLRALSHILRQTDYILSVSGDCDYPSILIDMVSDVLMSLSKDIEKSRNEIDQVMISDRSDHLDGGYNTEQV